MSTVTVKEGDGHTVSVAWKDGAGDPVTPTTCRYKIDCLTTRSAVLAWTTVGAASTVTIDIPGTANAIVDAANPSETKQITVQANAGLSTQKTVVGEYLVTNNLFV